MFPQNETIQRTAHRHLNRTRRIWMIALLALTAFPGCNVFSLRKQLKELESENNRLLTEFRAERQRRETAEQTAQTLETRLAESEKLLARQTQDYVPSRLSSLQNIPSLQGITGRPDVSTPFSQPNQTGVLPHSTGNGFQWQRRTK